MIEFFKGSGILADTFKEAGYEVFTIDNNPMFAPDLCIDILNFKIDMLPGFFRAPDVIHFGVPCQKFSIAGRSNNFINFMPVDLESCKALGLVYKCLDLVKELNPGSWFLENPIGYLRKFPFMEKYPRKEVWYCQYGDDKAKPTDFWTNRVDWIPKKCYNENPNCSHERSPRGSKCGTQGLSNSYTRGIYPKGLCIEIVEVCDNKKKEIQGVLK